MRITTDDRAVIDLCAELHAALEPDPPYRRAIPEPEPTSAAMVKAARARLTLVTSRGASRT